MISPSFEVAGEIYIHAASQAVWQKFSRLHDWAQWNTEVLAAHWLHGEEWQEGSTMELRHKSLFGVETSSVALIRMCVPANTVVWESQTGGMTVVNSASFSDDVGGCRLSARHTYHGLPSVALRLLASRQHNNLQKAMRELKVFVEGEHRRS